jgi:hypothetical protein
MISNVELNKVLQQNDAKMYIDGELEPRNMYIRKNEIVILDVDNEQYYLDREEFYNDVVIWVFNKSNISLKPLIDNLNKLYSEMR